MFADRPSAPTRHGAPTQVNGELLRRLWSTPRNFIALNLAALEQQSLLAVGSCDRERPHAPLEGDRHRRRFTLHTDGASGFR